MELKARAYLVRIPETFEVKPSSGNGRSLPEPESPVEVEGRDFGEVSLEVVVEQLVGPRVLSKISSNVNFNSRNQVMSFIIVKHPYLASGYQQQSFES